MKQDPPPSKATMTAFQYKIDLSIAFYFFFFLLLIFFRSYINTFASYILLN